MNCVKCEGKMIKVTLGDIEVDQCAECGGVWFDFGELEDVLDLEDAGAIRNAEWSEKSDGTQGSCPRCGGTGNMVPVKDSAHNIRVDTCPVCFGKWLDGGEFEQLKEKDVLGSASGLFRFLFNDSYE